MTSKKDIATVDAIMANMTLQELLAHRDGLNERISEIQEAEKEEFLEKIRSQWREMQQMSLNYGLSAEAALGIEPSKKRTTSNRTPSTNGDGRASAPPKYKDPVTGKTWSGRGQQASFITEAIASGRIKSKEDFLIKE